MHLRLEGQKPSEMKEETKDKTLTTYNEGDHLTNTDDNTGEKCVLCLNEEGTILADVMVYRRVFNSILRVNLEGMICKECNNEENVKQGLIIQVK